MEFLDEQSAPIPLTDIRSACTAPIKIDVAKVNEIDERLKARQVEVGPWRSFTRIIVAVFNPKFSAVWVFFALALSLYAGAQFGCPGAPFKFGLGCSSSRYIEESQLELRELKPDQIEALKATKKPVRIEDAAPGQNLSSNVTTHTQESGAKFNATAFQAVLVSAALIISLMRWQYGNDQASTNEIFERKKEINLLAIDPKYAPFFKIILQGATDREDVVDKHKRKEILGPVEMAAVINECQSNRSVAKHLSDALLAERKFKFEIKMYVFLELDNLEFALDKFRSGHLDAGQMDRACEIFESRCLNSVFRYLAVTQGLAYYSEAFHRVVCACVARGFVLSGEPMPDASATPPAGDAPAIGNEHNVPA